MKLIALGIWLLFLVILATGWIANIVQIAHASLDPLTAMLVLKIVAIFVAPVGSVLGWIGMF